MKITSSSEHRALRLLTQLHYGRPRPLNVLSKMRRRDHRQTSRWGWRTHIRGIGVGLKRTNLEFVESVRCLTVYVRRKLPEHRLPTQERIPKKLKLASLGEEVLTDIVELRGQIMAHSASMIQPGNNVGHEQGEPGTLGLLVTKTGSLDVLALGCSHVLARSGVVDPAASNRVEQPLDVNADPEQNRFGRLTGDFTTLSRDQRTSEDFALARVEVPWMPALADTGLIVSGLIDPADISQGTATLMNGVKTKDAHGFVLNSNWSGTINDVPFVGDVDFENLVSYQTACLPGDSGAIVLQDGTTLALGIHIAGSPADNFGLLMPLGPVFDRLGLQVVTKGGTE
jgi:hypothetical protein